MGGKTTVQAPQQVQAPSTADAIREYAAVQPILFQQQLDFAPKEAQQQLELLQQYAQPLGEAYQQAQEALYPGTSALQEQLVAQARQQMENPQLTESEKAQILSDINANIGTNVRSGIGDVFKARTFADLYEQKRQQGQNLALSLAGRQQLASPSTPSYTNMLGSLTPGQVLGYQSGIYSTQQAAAPVKTTTKDPWGTASGILQGLGTLAMASSASLKEDIKEVENALEIINKINPVNYKWIETGDSDGGVIAEQLEEVIPDAVVEIDGIKHIKPMMIMGYMIKAIQELKEKVG